MDNFYHQIKSTLLKYQINKFYVIGKGGSLNQLHDLDLSDGYLIAINDSYKLIEPNLIIYNKKWALNGSDKLKNKYLTLSSEEFLFDDSTSNQFFIREKNKVVYNNDLNLEAFQREKISFEEPLFITALKVVYDLSLDLNQKFKVYLLGFDFDFKSIDTYSASITSQKSNIDEGYTRAIFSLQKKLLSQMISNSSIKKNISLFHVGKSDLSQLSINEFRKNFETISKDLGDPGGVNITAELTTNHFGDKNLMIDMVKRSYLCGANLIKVQKRDPQTFYSKKELNAPYHSKFGETFLDYRLGLELNIEDFELLDETCKSLGISWFASVLDKPSFKFMMRFNPKIIKIPSTISNFDDYHSYVSRNYKESIVVSTGYTDKNYEEYIFNKFKDNKKIYMLQCTSSYPTKPEDCHIGIVRHYYNLSKNNPKIVSGYSSHDMGSLGSMMAVAAGAKMIEKHVKLKEEPWAHFDTVALSLKNDEFSDFVKDIRKASIMVKDEMKTIKKSEHHKYKTNKK